MATDWSLTGDHPKDTAPAGLGQRDWSLSGTEAPWRQNREPSWQTGGQRGTTDSGFNTEFYDTMRKQRKEEQDKIEADPTYVSRLYQRDDFAVLS